MLSLTVAMAKKEFRHILRDGQTLFIILTLPVAMMFLFGYALKSEIENARVVVITPTSNTSTRSLVASIHANHLFQVVFQTTSGDPHTLMIQHRAQAVIQLKPRYSYSMQNPPISITVWLDGSDPATATTLRQAFPAFFNTHLIQHRALDYPERVQINTRFLYNTEQKSSLFFVPGLMATLLAMISALLTSVTVTREKETGTLQNLRISKLRAHHIIMGKLIPYFVIATATGILILSVGFVFFGVIPQGSLVLLAWTSFIYLFANLGIGLFISTLVQRQQHAMLLALGITMMPVIMLSGFIFPIASLPLPLQWLSNILPATWYLQIVRGIILKASDFGALTIPITILSLMAFLWVALSSIRFSKET